MSGKTMSPFITSLLWAQNGIITAMVAARFDPATFERNLLAVRDTMRLAALSDVTSEEEKAQAGKEFDQIFDLYLRMFQTGDINANSDHGTAH